MFWEIISASVHHNHTHKAQTEKRRGWRSLNHCGQSQIRWSGQPQKWSGR